MLKVLSYNLYGVKNTPSKIPEWEIRQKNIEEILKKLLMDNDIKICCFQEVNEYNFNMLSQLLMEYHFFCLDKFPMKTQNINQYNIIAAKDEIKVNHVFCLPHGKDKEYKTVEKQVIDYGMSDYRTTVFVNFEYNDKKYLVGNIHTDYISTEGKIKGTIKSLDYMDSIHVDYKLIVGDMNMVSHMSEVYNILKQKDNYITLSRNKNFNISDNSWQGYGTMEQVNVDFAFIEKDKRDYYDYKIIKQEDMMKEGSDHRPIIIEIIE